MAKRVFTGLQRLAIHPFPGVWKAVKRLWIEQPTYRLRIGDYRVIYRIHEGKIFVLRVVNRKDLEKELRKLK